MAPDPVSTLNVLRRTSTHIPMLHRVFGVLIAGACLFLASPAFAARSPDTAVSYFSSAAQLLALTAAVIGCAAVFRSRMARESARINDQRRWSAWLTRGLVLLLLVSVGVNILQWSREIDERTMRLSANLTRPPVEEREAVGNAALNARPSSRQASHLQGIASDGLAALMERTANGNVTDTNFIDIREPEEWEASSLAGFAHVRYAELLERMKELRLKKSKNVLLSRFGYRSLEMCNELKKRGIDCRFVIGGYEKWLADGKPVDSGQGIERKSLRALLPYPNKDRLLDTPEVRTVVAKEHAVFVDVRDPKEFKHGHLPGAVNLPIHKMQTSEIEVALTQLPGRPVIAPCYDERSCFYSQILGLRLHRRGLEFRGRYAVPHNYFMANARDEQVATWLDAHDATIVGKFQRPFEDGLVWLKNRTGRMSFAIILAALLLALALLPLTVKGERDRIVEQRLRPRLAELKSRLAHDPHRYRRAVRFLIETNGITPARNLVGRVIQTTLQIVLFSAVFAVTRAGSERFLWVFDIGRPDPLHLAPIVLGLLVFLHLQSAGVQKSAKYVGLRSIAGVFVSVITLELSMALNLYLVCGVGLMLVQDTATRWFLRRSNPKAPLKRTLLPQQIADLRDADRVSGVGRKAGRLALMMRNRLPVPEGFVIPNALFSEEGQLTSSEQRTVETFRRQLRLTSMAVRGSALSEDGEQQRYAGQFGTMLNVDRDSLQTAITKIHKTLHGSVAASYGNGKQTGGGVIVQQIVDADYAGILFTEHPMDSGATFIEMTCGLGEKPATGAETPDKFTFGRFSRLPLGAEEPPIDLTPLLELGTQVERMFGQPQDIEWAYRGGRFHLLQARDITNLQRLKEDDADQTTFERERHRLLEIAKAHKPGTTVFNQNELSELLPQPTPLSLDLMQARWRPGGSIDTARRKLGIPYDAPEDGADLLVPVFGRLYLNVPEQHDRGRSEIGAMAAFRLARSAEQLEHEFTGRFLPGLIRDLLPRESMDLSVLSDPDLVTLLEDTCDRYINETHVQVDVIDIAAEFFLKSAEARLQRKGLPVRTILGQGANTILHQAISLLRKVRENSATPDEFLKFFGHRAPVDYELAMPRYCEDVGLMESLIRTAVSDPASEESMPSQANVAGDPALATAVARARRFQALKEEAKHHSLRQFAVLRRLLIELDTRLEFGGAIFHLHLHELAALRDAGKTDELRTLANRRRQTSEQFATLNEPPASLTLQELERLSVRDGWIGAFERQDGEMHGTLVAGTAEVTGRARVLTSRNISEVRDGEIVITRYMHPDWALILPRLTGIVTEVGGGPSHMSILAREYDVTTITGVKDAEYRIKTGDLIRLKLDGTIEYPPDESGSPELPERKGTEVPSVDGRQAYS